MGAVRAVGAVRAEGFGQLARAARVVGSVGVEAFKQDKNTGVGGGGGGGGEGGGGLGTHWKPF